MNETKKGLKLDLITILGLAAAVLSLVQIPLLSAISIESGITIESIGKSISIEKLNEVTGFEVFNTISIVLFVLTALMMAALALGLGRTKPIRMMIIPVLTGIITFADLYGNYLMNKQALQAKFGASATFELTSMGILTLVTTAALAVLAILCVILCRMTYKKQG